VLDAIVRQFQAKWFSKRSIDDTRNDDTNGEKINANPDPNYIPMLSLDAFLKATLHDSMNKNRFTTKFSQARRSYLSFSRI
jgi:hypothetical protein